MTKQELIDLVLTKEEKQNCDIGVPKKFSDRLRELGVSDMVGRNFVWIYPDRHFVGYPVNLLERFYQLYSNADDYVHMCQDIVNSYYRNLPTKVIYDISYLLNETDKAKVEMLEEFGKDFQSSTPKNIPEDEFQAILTKIVKEKDIESLLDDPEIHPLLMKKYNDDVFDRWKKMEGIK